MILFMLKVCFNLDKLMFSSMLLIRSTHSCDTMQHSYTLKSYPILYNLTCI